MTHLKAVISTILIIAGLLVLGIFVAICIANPPMCFVVGGVLLVGYVYIGMYKKLAKIGQPLPRTEVSNDVKAVRSKSRKKRRVREGTAKALVISLLKEGPQTKDSLAKAIVAKGLSKNTDITKVKGYVAVILSLLKSVDRLPVRPVEGKRSTYMLAEAEEATKDE